MNTALHSPLRCQETAQLSPILKKEELTRRFCLIESSDYSHPPPQQSIQSFVHLLMSIMNLYLAACQFFKSIFIRFISLWVCFACYCWRIEYADLLCFSLQIHLLIGLLKLVLSKFSQIISLNSVLFFNTRFYYDHSFWSHNSLDKAFADQATVYNCIGVPLLDRCLEGYNCSLFAYGQTGSGKSYRCCKAYIYYLSISTILLWI